MLFQLMMYLETVYIDILEKIVLRHQAQRVQELQRLITFFVVEIGL
jgi:hypothetical protein